MAPCGIARADVIAVLNAGFEDPVMGDDEFTTTGGPNWDLGFYDVASPTTWQPGGVDEAGIWNPPIALGYTDGAFAGENVGWAISHIGVDRGLSQILTDTLQANMEYHLELQVGNSLYNQSDQTAPYRFELLAGGVLLQSATGDSPVADTWGLRTLTYTSSSRPAQLGELLEIRLLAVDYTDGDGVDGYEIEFDEVTLTAIQPSAGGFVITEISMDADNMITLTWSSRPDRTYGIFYGHDLVSFDADVSDSVTTAEDENPDDGDKITVSFPNPTITAENPSGAPTLLLRVEDLTDA